jgi:hypothetical protein
LYPTLFSRLKKKSYESFHNEITGQLKGQSHEIETGRKYDWIRTSNLNLTLNR